MNIPAFSTDVLIVAATLLVAMYGLLAGQAALIREAISIYVGLVIALYFGKPLFDYLQQSAGGNLPVNQSSVQLILLALPIIMLQFAHHKAHIKAHSSIVMTFILALLVALLAVSSVITQLDPVALNRIRTDSNLASWIYDLRLAWIGLVPVSIAMTAILQRRQAHRH